MGNISQRRFSERTQIPDSRTVPKIHQIFRHAQNGQFPRIGRKYRIQQERDSRTARAFSHFDRGVGAWPKLENVLRELRAIETRRDPGDQMTWSLATLKRSIARLESRGILQRHGIRRRPGGQWGSRERTMHPEKLLSRECEPRWKPESEPLEFKDFEVHTSKKPDEPLLPKTGSDVRRPEFSKPKPKTAAHDVAGPIAAKHLLDPEVAAGLWDLVREWQLRRWDPAADLGSWCRTSQFLAYASRTLRNDPKGERLIFHPRKYVLGCLENFNRAYSPVQQAAILDTFAAPSTVRVKIIKRTPAEERRARQQAENELRRARTAKTLDCLDHPERLPEHLQRALRLPDRESEKKKERERQLEADVEFNRKFDEAARRGGWQQ